jgi:hypothetical protein
VQAVDSHFLPENHGKSPCSPSVLPLYADFCPVASLPPSGTTACHLRYTLRQRKCSAALGGFGALTVDEARVIANQYKALIAQGRDPKQERDEFKNRVTFANFVSEHYLPHARTYKRSVSSDESKFKLYLIPKFGHEPLTAQTV